MWQNVASGGSVPGAAKLLVVDGVALHSEEQVFTAMLTGFANQQLARNLARTTVEGRESTVKAFAAYVNTFPWQWTAAMVDEWLGDLRSLRVSRTRNRAKRTAPARPGSVNPRRRRPAFDTRRVLTARQRARTAPEQLRIVRDLHSQRPQPG